MVHQACGTIRFDDCFILVHLVEHTSQNCPIYRGSETLIKKSRLSGLGLLTRKERWARLPRADIYLVTKQNTKWWWCMKRKHWVSQGHWTIARLILLSLLIWKQNGNWMLLTQKKSLSVNINLTTQILLADNGSLSWKDEVITFTHFTLNSCKDSSSLRQRSI